jgi:hypothetical protein
MNAQRVNMGDLLDMWLLKELKNKHHLSDPETFEDRLSKLRRWLGLDTYKNVKNKQVCASLMFLKANWDCAFFFPFISEVDATNMIRTQSHNFIVRLSATKPNALTVTFYAPEYNDIRHTRFNLYMQQISVVDNPYINKISIINRIKPYQTFKEFISTFIEVMRLKNLEVKACRYIH